MTNIGKKRVCFGCINDYYLKEEVRKKGLRRKCDYCGKTRKGISLDDLVVRIEEVFEKFFQLTESEPSGIDYALIKDGGWWDRPGEQVVDVIVEIAGVEEKIAKDVQTLLYEKHFDFDAAKEGVENPFDEEAHYEEFPPDPFDFTGSWNFFKANLKYEARFFSIWAEEALVEIFHDLEGLRTYDGKSVIHTIKPGDDFPLFRARVAHSEIELEEILRSPSRELGPPPPTQAKNGRMNAYGISVFYGGKDQDTCVTEVRPPVGSYVVVGHFQIIRPVLLLDLGTLTKVFSPGSYFDPESPRRWGRAAFLKNLVHEFSKPIMPEDEEFEYLPTQAVAEYMAARITPSLDGIEIPSSQTGGKGRNVVLFHHASKVEPYKVPKGTEISVKIFGQSEDEEDLSISVFETHPREEEPNPEPTKRTGFSPFNPLDFIHSDALEEKEEDYPDSRKATLRLEVNEIHVRKITGVEYRSWETKVYRHNNKKG